MIFIFGFFLWVALSQAIANDERIAAGKGPAEAETSNSKTWVWPDLVYIEFLAMIIVTVLLIAWSILLQAPLESPANPGRTPNPSKAPWYFLGLQEMLVYFDPWMAGVVLPSMIILGLCAIPYIDRNPKGQGYFTLRERKLAIGTFLYGFLVLWVFMIVTGTVLRGPGWNFFGPFERWDPHRVLPLNNVNLSEIVWIDFIYGKLHLGNGLPLIDTTGLAGFLPFGKFLQAVGQAIYREWPGITFLVLYLGVLPVVLQKTWLKKLYAQLGPERFHLLMNLYLVASTLPIKMVGRWVFNLKYIVATPWVNF
ncbi:MAG: cytochrome C [Verrucomicrobiae bacterium]|nr:cytochrome C [Verrucomicrobiae bacterium]